MVVEPFEMGPIRPPSEAYSLLIRATRNCPWNRCRFCNTYKGSRFELRPVADIKRDIATARAIQDEIRALAARLGHREDVRGAVLAVLRSPPSHAHYNVALWLHAGGQHVFLQDANTLIMRTADLVEVLTYLKDTLPTVTRITSYGRSHTAARKTIDELRALREAGLSRIHIGLESGSDSVLKLMDKGVTAAEHIKGGRNVVASGISLSEYVLLGLGGQGLWREHAVETARVLSAINPDYIRIRTLGIYPGLEMCKDVERGAFVRQSDEAMTEELRVMIENLECESNLVSDHIGNLLEEVQGKLPGDKPKMLGVIARFQSLPEGERTVYRVGRRAGLYASLDDLADPRRRATVEGIIDRLSDGTGQVSDDIIHNLRLAYT
jgi:hypothetical protein